MNTCAERQACCFALVAIQSNLEKWICNKRGDGIAFHHSNVFGNVYFDKRMGFFGNGPNPFIEVFNVLALYN